MNRFFALITLIMPLIAFACGCTDAGAVSSFTDSAKSSYDSADKDFASVVNSTNEILDDIKSLATTESLILNDSIKYQQVYYDYLIFTLQNRQMINADIQQDNIGLEIGK